MVLNDCAFKKLGDNSNKAKERERIFKRLNDLICGINLVQKNRMKEGTRK